MVSSKSAKDHFGNKNTHAKPQLQIGQSRQLGDSWDSSSGSRSEASSEESIYKDWHPEEVEADKSGEAIGLKFFNKSVCLPRFSHEAEIYRVSGSI